MRCGGLSGDGWWGDVEKPLEVGMGDIEVVLMEDVGFVGTVLEVGVNCKVLLVVYRCRRPGAGLGSMSSRTEMGDVEWLWVYVVHRSLYWKMCL